MPDNPKGRRDHDAIKDTANEIRDEVTQDRFAPKYSQPNRDRARGDSDRTQRREDAGRSRDTTPDRE